MERLSEPAVYISKHAEYVLVLEGTRKVFDGGKWGRIRGKRAEFHSYRYTTTDPEKVKLMDELLNGPSAERWTKRFYKVPNQKEIKEMGQIVERRQQLQKQVEGKLDEEFKKKDKYTKFDEFMQRQKNLRPEVVPGMRSISR